MLMSVPCTKCGAPLSGESFNTGSLTACPKCGALVQLEVFPAFFRPQEVGRSGERVAVEEESSCFYHPKKKAVILCDACGRFLCALCDLELDGKHLCPACLESGKKKRTLQSLEDARTLYNRQALALAVLPFFISGLAAIYFAARYWKAPTSLVRPANWAMPLALVLAILQTLGFAIVIFVSLAR
jgi:hypothetical protein